MSDVHEAATDRPDDYWEERRRVREQKYSREELEHYLAIHVLRERRALEQPAPVEKE